MVRWHRQLNGHEFEQILGDSKAQGTQACCSPWESRTHRASEQQQQEPQLESRKTFNFKSELFESTKIRLDWIVQTVLVQKSYGTCLIGAGEHLASKSGFLREQNTKIMLLYGHIPWLYSIVVTSKYYHIFNSGNIFSQV